MVAGSLEKTSPSLWMAAHLVKEQQVPDFRLEEHGIEAWKPLPVRLIAVRHLDRRAPFAALMTREPDAHVRVPFARPAEPSRHESVARLHNRRGMATRKRR